jgi:hypothetical protein
MSASGHYRRFGDVRITSAYPLIASKIADIAARGACPFGIREGREDQRRLLFWTLTERERTLCAITPQ